MYRIVDPTCGHAREGSVMHRIIGREEIPLNWKGKRLATDHRHELGSHKLQITLFDFLSSLGAGSFSTYFVGQERRTTRTVRVFVSVLAVQYNTSTRIPSLPKYRYQVPGMLVKANLSKPSDGARQYLH
jgi:hypothetical protein